jgi:hypothetical protein
MQSNHNSSSPQARRLASLFKSVAVGDALAAFLPYQPAETMSALSMPAADPRTLIARMLSLVEDDRRLDKDKKDSLSALLCAALDSSLADLVAQAQMLKIEPSYQADQVALKYLMVLIEMPELATSHEQFESKLRWLASDESAARRPVCIARQEVVEVDGEEWIELKAFPKSELEVQRSAWEDVSPAKQAVELLSHFVRDYLYARNPDLQDALAIFAADISAEDKLACLAPADNLEALKTSKPSRYLFYRIIELAMRLPDLGSFVPQIKMLLNAAVDLDEKSSDAARLILIHAEAVERGYVHVQTELEGFGIKSTPVAPSPPSKKLQALSQLFAILQANAALKTHPFVVAGTAILAENSSQTFDRIVLLAIQCQHTEVSLIATICKKLLFNPQLLLSAGGIAVVREQLALDAASVSVSSPVSATTVQAMPPTIKKPTPPPAEAKPTLDLVTHPLLNIEGFSEPLKWQINTAWGKAFITYLSQPYRKCWVKDLPPFLIGKVLPLFLTAVGRASPSETEFFMHLVADLRQWLEELQPVEQAYRDDPHNLSLLSIYIEKMHSLARYYVSACTEEPDPHYKKLFTPFVDQLVDYIAKLNKVICELRSSAGAGAYSVAQLHQANAVEAGAQPLA